MESNLLSDFQQILKSQTKTTPLSLKPFSLARSLIVNPSTSDHTFSSLLQTLETLIATSTTPKSAVVHVTALLSEIAERRRNFAPVVATILCSLSPDIPPHAASLALSALVSVASASVATEGPFLSLCFGPCVPVRHRLLRDAGRFGVRPSIALTLLLGFTKDPYPYVRRAALDGLAGLCEWIVVDDRSMIEGCYFRAVELLFDSEESVRSSAVHVVSGWGKLLVAISNDESKTDWSDAVYVQLCSMVRDMSVTVRVEAFLALGKAGTVSEYVLMQTLSKKVLPIAKDKKFPGQSSVGCFDLPASSAAGAFIHGLEDEFHEVRSLACYSMRTPTILSTDFAAGALNLLTDVLNDDSMAVRLQALETMHHMAVFGHLRVQEVHMHMFLGTLVDTNSLIRSAARKVVKLTKLHDLPMFKLAVDSLVQSLDVYPQDEPDVLSVIFSIGRGHGSFAVNVIKEVFSEIEPFSESNWDFDSPKTAARLVLAISAQLSKQRQSYSIPPTTYSYAVTMLGRISRGLIEYMDQNTLLAYLSHCSRSTLAPPIKLVTGDDNMVDALDGFEVLSEPKKRAGRLEGHDEAEFILADVGETWALTKMGCLNEVLSSLRSWKDELATSVSDPRRSGSVSTFVSQYLDVVKLLSKAWFHVTCPVNLNSIETGDFRYVLRKLDRRLRDLRYRFIGLSKEEETHVLELTLVAYTLRLSVFDRESTLTKLRLTKSLLDSLHGNGSSKPSGFVTELTKLLRKTDENTDTFRFRSTTLESFSLNRFPFRGSFKYMKAEVGDGNDWRNPLPFVSGLPVGIPLRIRLHNTPVESKLWVTMAVYEDSKEYAFVDLKRFGGSDELREFRFTPPFYGTPRVKSFTLRVRIGMECLFEDARSFGGRGGPRHELVYLCKEKEVSLR